MIHVCFGLYDKTGQYSKFTGTAMLSLFENTNSNVTVHILHDNTLTDDNRDKFSYVAGQYNQTVKFYNVDELCADKLKEYVNLLPVIRDSRVTVAGFYRLLIPQLFSSAPKKMIYLDSDVIVNLDISELWQIELQDKALAAVNEIETSYNPPEIALKYLVTSGLVAHEDYFCSGVLVMNLKKLCRAEEQIINGLKWRNAHPQCKNFDQDVLNYAFTKDYLKLESKFDNFVSRARKLNKMRPSIYHYVGSTLQADINDPFNRLWFDYFGKTPWFDVTVIKRMNECIDNLSRELGQKRRNSLIKFSAVLSGKSRVFVVKGTNDIDWLKKTYSVRADEEFFVFESDESLPRLIEEMETSRDKKLFLIRVAELINPLKEAGFVEEQDFFNHYVLFSANLLSKKDFYALLKEL